MDAAQDPLLATLSDCVRTRSAAASVNETLLRVIQKLDTSTGPMAWDVISLDVFGDGLPGSIRSCWIFVIRAGAATGAERHPNSHQRSLSLTGSGTFELRDGPEWSSHPLLSIEGGSIHQRWVSIPPLTWHRLFAGSEAWGMISFHTVPAEALIEERPVDAEDLEGQTRQERYADRR